MGAVEPSSRPDLGGPGAQRVFRLGESFLEVSLEGLPAVLAVQLEGDFVRPTVPAQFFSVSLAPDGYVGGNGSDGWHLSGTTGSAPSEAGVGLQVAATYRPELATCLCELQAEFEITEAGAMRVRLWAIPYQRVREDYVLHVGLPFVDILGGAGRANGLEVLVPAANASTGTYGEVTVFSRLTGGGLDGCVPLALWKAPLGRVLMVRITDAAFDPIVDLHENGSGGATYRVRIPAVGGRRVCLVELEIAAFDGGWPALIERWSAPLQRKLDTREYLRPDLEWYRGCFVGHFVFCFSDQIYDAARGRYRADEYARELEETFGGVDFLIYWYTFPRLGVDPRTQFQLLDDLPGGRAAVREFFDDARQHGIRPFIQYIPWDTARRDEDHPASLARAVSDIGADGVFLDTVDAIQPEFRERIDSARAGVALMPEMRPTITPDMRSYGKSTGSWAQRSPTKMPTLDLVRFTVPHHRVFLVHREERDRRAQIQSAFFNAEGIVLWDRNFAIPAYNGREANVYSADDAALVRRYRSAWTAHADAYDSDRPEPLIPTSAPRLHANRFPIDGKRVVHVFNASSDPYEGPLYGERLDTDWHVVDWLGRRELQLTSDERGGQTIYGRVGGHEVLCVAAFRRLLQPSLEEGLVRLRGSGPPGDLALHALDGAGRDVVVEPQRMAAHDQAWNLPGAGDGFRDLWLELRAAAKVIDAQRVR
jgi:hypothetical protein